MRQQKSKINEIPFPWRERDVFLKSNIRINRRREMRHVYSVDNLAKNTILPVFKFRTCGKRKKSFKIKGCNPKVKYLKDFSCVQSVDNSVDNVEN